MNVKPILFSGPMVRAILEGRKMQTRRVLKPQPQFLTGRRKRIYADDDWRASWGDGDHDEDLPYQPGDLLWCRESIRWSPEHLNGYYMADGRGVGEDVAHVMARKEKSTPSIYMPRLASRLTLEVIDVRVQRLQSISEEDAWEEGAERMVMDEDEKFYPNEIDGTCRTGFAGLWEHLNGPRGYGWDENPWVVAISFRPHHKNVDALLAERDAA